MLTAYQRKRIKGKNAIEAENGCQGPRKWQTTQQQSQEAIGSNGAYGSVVHTRTTGLTSGFSSCVGPTNVDSINKSNQYRQKRPSSAKFSHKNPIEGENSGWGPAEWSVTSKATTHRNTVADAEASVSFGSGDGVPQYRIDTGYITGQENRNSWNIPKWRRPGSAKQSECPIYSNRNSRGKNEDPWATTTQLAYQAPPPTNNYLAFRNNNVQ